ncbi:ABC transporter ATP-binding protein [Pseudonocardia sp. DLS-67]
MLQVRGLDVSFPSPTGVVRAVTDLDLDVERGRSLCLTGESGSGKSIVALAIAGLLPASASVTGSIRLNGTELTGLSPARFRALRGSTVAMAFEQPWTCLNPTRRVGDQIAEAVRVRRRCSRAASRSRALGLMEQVGIADAARRYRDHPHEFSGGMQQRAVIAIALAGEPELLIADEPTTALDITVQAQIILLLRELTAAGTTLLLITHDLAVAGGLCDRLAVMYAGELVEHGNLAALTRNARHPYSRALVETTTGDRLRTIPGTMPQLSDLPAGCRFHPRCPQAVPDCRTTHPPLVDHVRCPLWNR